MSQQPQTDELRAMVETIRSGGILYSHSYEDPMFSWHIAALRYVNRLGPDEGHDAEYAAVVDAMEAA